MPSFEKNGFLLYKSYRQSIDSLTREDRGDLLAAIFEYQTDGKITTPLSPLCSMAFTFIQAQFEIDKNKYLDIVERNRANGSKGGRPKNNTKKPTTHWVLGCENADATRDFAAFEHKQKNEQKNPKADNDNDNGNGNGNGITPPLSPSKEGENNNNNNIVCCSAHAQENEYDAIEFEIIKYFAKRHFESNAEDFIAYNKARNWKGFGGEDVREDYTRYADRWEDEHLRRVNLKP